jgi:uncharacterized protein YjbI with pentapeptide repeats
MGISMYNNNPRAVKRIKKLFDLDNKELAKDPNTPLNQLFLLAENYPSFVLANPVFDLIPLENLLAKVSEDAQCQLLKQPECPKWFIELAYLNTKYSSSLLSIVKWHSTYWNELRRKHPNYLPNLKNTSFHIVRYCGLGPADFSNIDFTGSILRYIGFRSCDFSNANFSYCDLHYVDFGDSLLQNCSFKDADFCNVDFPKRKILNCNFSQS